MRNSTIVFKIVGRDVTPESVALRDLLETLTLFEKAAVAAVESHAPGAISKEELQFSLVDVEKGSDVVTLAGSGWMARAVERFAQSLEADEFVKLPNRTRTNLMKMWERAQQCGWDSIGLSVGNREAVISMQRPLATAGSYVEHTTIYGICIDAGGKSSPTVKLEPLDGGPIITAAVPSREFARTLGNRLYEPVGLIGIATREIESGRILTFKAEGITELTGPFSKVRYRQNTREAFAELARLSEGVWDSVDPDEWVSAQREG